MQLKIKYLSAMNLAMLNKNKTDEGSQLNSKFKDLANELVRFGSTIQVKITPYLSEDIPFYSALSVDDKRRIVSGLESYLEICNDCISLGNHLSNSKALVWNALKTLGLTPTSDLFNFFQDGDLIEIYSSDNIQIFRNFKFFELCSYTIEDIFCRPWTELFFRPAEAMNTLVTEINKTWESKHTRPVSIEDHSVDEISSVFKRSFSDEIKYLSPLFQNGQVAAFLVGHHAYLTNDIGAQKEEEILTQLAPKTPYLELL